MDIIMKHRSRSSPYKYWKDTALGAFTYPLRPLSKMNLQRYALVIAAFLLSRRAGAVHALKRHSHQSLPYRDHFRHLGDTPIPVSNDDPPSPNSRASHEVTGGCFPALGYTPPPVGSIWETPNVPLDQWRCDIETERGFLGFSYE